MAHGSAATRRALVRGAGVVATAAAVTVARPGGADAAAYVPGHYQGGNLLPEDQRHLVTRFSYGLTPALATEVQAAGGAVKWFTRQLNPALVTDTFTAQSASWFPSLDRSPEELWKRQVDLTEPGWQVMQDYQRLLLLRRVMSKRQVLEVMTEFWEHLLHVPVVDDGAFTHRASYGAMIRSKALGRYDALLHAAITHPAMLVYLDGATSTKSHPNENLGRELLELHTVGRGQYDEDDVKNSARILTGYHVDKWRTWAASYRTGDHYTGAVQVMGFRAANLVPDGRDVVKRYLSYLAHHPATAQRIARRLAVKFVRDDPPTALVNQLASIYLKNKTDIRPVLQALVASSAFKTSAGAKLRDPGEDVVATYRALGVTIGAKPTGAPLKESAHVSILWQAMNLGQAPGAWPQPNGQPLDNESWSSPSRMIASLEMHYLMSGAWWPKTGMTYRPPAAWLPKTSIRMDELVDYLSQRLLHRRSTSTLLQACCESVGVEPTTWLSPTSDVVRWHLMRVLSTILDSPAHLTR
ncbi:DUF1800 domain-containing protein [Nocardioides sp. SYSU D00038]|uniref:DUF1800 domain-containing protein n=1 Tax=Nocardioides sp. SYSU D00038 TaxID=2812554 RepID=UPI0019687738|nr:DUF1800 domain-containing protein [Nocardioides sp. SYSU D00038]